MKFAHPLPVTLLALGLGLSSIQTAHADPAMLLKGVVEIGGNLFMHHREKVKEGEAMNLKAGLFTEEKCLEPVGTLRIHEPDQGGWQSYGLPAPTRVLQAIVNDSNCFRVVDRSMGFEVAQQERALALAGQLANSQSLANAQILGADYVLVPGIIVENAQAGGSGFSAGNLLGGIGLKSRKKTAEVVLTLMDVRTSEQIISVTGEANIADIDFSMTGTDGAGTTASASNWSNTSIGKVIKTAYEESYKKMILEVGQKDLLARYQPQSLEGNVTELANQLIDSGVSQAQQAVSQHATQLTAQADQLQAIGQTVTPTASALINSAAAIANSQPTASLANAEALQVRRRARLFSEPSLQSSVVSELHQGMLVYPQGPAQNSMLQVEDELGNRGWLPQAHLQAAQ